VRHVGVKLGSFLRRFAMAVVLGLLENRVMMLFFAMLAWRARRLGKRGAVHWNILAWVETWCFL